MAETLYIAITGRFQTTKRQLMSKLWHYVQSNCSPPSLTFDLTESLKKTLADNGRDVTMEGLNELSASLSQIWGPDFLIERMTSQISRLYPNVVIMKGLSRQPEVDWVKTQSNHHLIYIESDDDVRYQRHLDEQQVRLKDLEDKRAVSLVLQKMERAEFDRLMNDPPESIIPTFKDQAATKLVNNSFGGKHDTNYLRQLDDLFDELKNILPP